MKISSISTIFVAFLTGGLLLAGCGHKEGDGHDHGKEASEEKGGHGHGHGEESPSGASFNAGKGVAVTEATKKLLDLTVMDVEERKVAHQIPLTLQVFGENHHHVLGQTNHSGCDVHGSGLLADDTASVVKIGQRVRISKGSNILDGVVQKVQKAPALGETEIVIGVFNATAILKPSEFVPAQIIPPGDDAVAAVPQSALLRTSEGTFVYAVNGDAYFRTAVKTGAASDGWVEVTDGLLAGDQVVTKPVETLWLIELRATKGGGHSH